MKRSMAAGERDEWLRAAWRLLFAQTVEAERLVFVDEMGILPVTEPSERRQVEIAISGLSRASSLGEPMATTLAGDAARGDRLEAIYVLAIHTGMRRGELLGLRWEDVDLENATARVRRTLTRIDNGRRLALGPPKNKQSRRTVRLTERAVESLRGHLERQLAEIEALGDLYKDQGLVFTTEAGMLINPSNLRQRSLAQVLKRAGLPQITFHDLRHTCASLLFQRNVHPKFVQELLGHASVAITLDTYSHMLPGMGSEAADAIEEALG